MFQLRRLVLLAILLASWEFASRYILDKTQATLLPPPSGVLKGAVELSSSGELWKHVLDSLRREFIAFCYASVAIPLGIVIPVITVFPENAPLAIVFMVYVIPLCK